MDSIEKAIADLAAEAEQVKSQTPSEDAKDLLDQAASLLRAAATAHHDGA